MATLRAYQQAIACSIVRTEGGIVYLPTGAGKTLIAAEVVRQCFQSQLAQAREIGSEGPPRNTAMIVVPTVALLTQQRDYFATFFDSKMPNDVDCLKIEGGRAFPTVDKPKKFRLLVGVSQAMRNNLPLINSNDVAILVVDEVHHCTGQHPSAAVAKWARDRPTPPWIVGLTASLSYARHDDAIAADIVAVCDCLGVKNSSIFSATTIELEEGGYHAPAAARPIPLILDRHEKRLPGLESRAHQLPQAVLQLVAQSSSLGGGSNLAGVMPLFTACFEALLALEDRVAEKYSAGDTAQRRELQPFRRFLAEDRPIKFDDLADVPGKLFMDLMADTDVDPYSLVPTIEQYRQKNLELLESHVLLAAYLHLSDVVHLLTVTAQECIEIAYWYLKDFALPELVHPSVSEVCPGLVQLLCASNDDEVTRELTDSMGHDVPLVVELLKDWLDKTESSQKAAVFATHRLSVVVLTQRLNVSFQDERPNVAISLYARKQRVGWHVGGKLSNTAFGERIATFRNNSTVNILVATQVCEEGLDIPSCGNVIHFDLPYNPVSLVQRAGRARAEESAVHVLGDVEHLAKAVSVQHRVAEAAADGALLHLTQLSGAPQPGQQNSDLQRREAQFKNFVGLFVKLSEDPKGKTPLQVLNELLQSLGEHSLACDPKRQRRSGPDVFDVTHPKVDLLHPKTYESFTLECPKTFSGKSKNQVKQDAASGLLDEIRIMLHRALST